MKYLPDLERVKVKVTGSYNHDPPCLFTMKVIDYITKTRESGRPVLGCFPLYPPMELFHSMGIKPVVLWGLRDDLDILDESDRHLQNYTCSVARRLAEFLLSDYTELLDGIFMYNAGDTLRNLPEIIEQGLATRGRDCPPFMKLHVPAVSPNHNPASVDYLKQKIRNLIDECTRIFGTEFSEKRFWESVEIYRKWRSLLLEGDRAVAAGWASFADFQEAAMAGYFLPVDEHIRMMEEFIQGADAPGREDAGVPVILSGILPPPREVTLAMERAGLRIVGNDIASLYRSYARTPEASGDPRAWYADFYLNHFPCTTILHHVDRRLGAVEDLVRERVARGIIFIGEKFCEYEYFEFPLAENYFRGKGVQTLVLEFSADDREGAARYETRIETFAEMIKQGIFPV